MNIREMVLKNKSHIYPKDILKKTFLFDDKTPAKIIHVDNKRADNERYLIKVIFEGEQRPLCLTKHAFRELRNATSNYAGIVVRVRFDGKQGDKKATKWLFSVVTEEKKQEKQEFSLIAAMK